MRSLLPKSVFSPTQYFVWTRWEVTQTRRGWIKLICIRRTTTSKNWIVSMTCRRSSNWNYSQDSRPGTFSKRFKNSWKVFSVNLSTSLTESSSCPCSVKCSMKLCGKKTTIQKNVIRILLKLGNLLRDFIAVIGVSWTREDMTQDFSFW